VPDADDPDVLHCPQSGTTYRVDGDRLVEEKEDIA
jgi:hypothetical protein